MTCKIICKNVSDNTVFLGMTTPFNMIIHGCPEKSMEELHRANLQYKLTVYFGGIAKLRMYFINEVEARGVAERLKGSGLKSILLEKIVEITKYDTHEIPINI